MENRARQTTENDLLMCSQPKRDDNSHFVNVWPEGKHRAAWTMRIWHTSSSNQNLIANALVYHFAGLVGVNRSIEFMRIVVTDKGKGYGRAAVSAIKRYASMN